MRDPRIAAMLSVIGLVPALAHGPAPHPISGGTTSAANAPRYRFPRAKAAQAKPRKRPNLRHVSKRVKRKHRRAA